MTSAPSPPAGTSTGTGSGRESGAATTRPQFPDGTCGNENAPSAEIEVVVNTLPRSVRSSTRRRGFSARHG